MQEPTKYTKKVTVKGIVNKALRTPQRVKDERLNTGVVTRENVFKNKSIIQVCFDIEPRFLQNI